MPGMFASAENAYLFRHVVLRDMAYQLQTPGDRARLHGLALRVLEAEIPDNSRDSLAAELADHAGLGAMHDAALATTELAYLDRALLHALKTFRTDTVATLALKVASHPQVELVPRLKALVSAAGAKGRQGRAAESLKLLQSARELVSADVPLEVQRSIASYLLSVYSESGDRESAQAELALLQQMGAGGDVEVAARVCGDMGRYFDINGNPEAAEREYRRCIELFDELGKPDESVPAMINLGGMLAERGQHDAGSELLQRALAISEQHNLARFIPVTVGNLAWQAQQQRRYPEALQLFTRAVALARESGNRYDLATILGNLGVLHADRGDTDDAVRVLAESLELHAETANRRGFGTALSDLASAHLTAGNTRQALDLALKALPIHSEFHNLRAMSLTTGTIARAQYVLGSFDEAMKSTQRALAHAREHGDENGVAGHLELVGRILHLTGRIAEANAVLDETEKLADRLNNQRVLSAIQDTRKRMQHS